MSPADSEPPSVTVTGEFGKKGEWSLTLGNAELVLAAKSGDERYVFPPSDYHKKIALHAKVGGRPLLIVSLPKRCGFTMSPTDAETVQTWLGPLGLDHLKDAIEKASIWSLPLGIILVAVAFFGADGSIDFVPAGLGILLLLIFTLSKSVVHPAVLLLSALWSACAAASIVYDLANGASLMWNLPFLFILALCAKYGWNEYRRFQSIRVAIENVESST